MIEKEKIKTLLQFISPLDVNKIQESILDGISQAMDEWARDYHKRQLKEFRKNIKVTKAGHINELRIVDYIKKDGWKIDSYGYKYPGIIQIKMVNVSESSNPRKSYNQDVSFSTMKTRICPEVYGHCNVEKTDEFDEVSLIRKHKIIK